MKLYRVTVEIDLVVAANSEREAEQEADSIVSVEDGGAEINAAAFEITDVRRLPHGWDAGAIPFNSERDRSIAEYFPAPSAPNGRVEP